MNLLKKINKLEINRKDLLTKLKMNIKDSKKREYTKKLLEWKDSKTPVSINDGINIIITFYKLIASKLFIYFPSLGFNVKFLTINP